MQAEPILGKDYRIEDLRAHIKTLQMAAMEKAAQKEEMRKAMAQNLSPTGYAAVDMAALFSPEDDGEGGHGTLDLTDPNNYYARFLRMQEMETAGERTANPDMGKAVGTVRAQKEEKEQTPAQKEKPVPEKGKGGEAGREGEAREGDIPGRDMPDTAASPEQDRDAREKTKDPHTRKAEKARALRHDPKARAENMVNAKKEDIGQRLDEKIEKKALLDALVFQNLMRQAFEGRELDLDTARQKAEQEVQRMDAPGNAKRAGEKKDPHAREKDALKDKPVAEGTPEAPAKEEVKSRTQELRQDPFDEEKNTVAEKLVVGQDLSRTPESTLGGQTPGSQQTTAKEQQERSESRNVNREVIQSQPPLPRGSSFDTPGRVVEGPDAPSLNSRSVEQKAHDAVRTAPEAARAPMAYSVPRTTEDAVHAPQSAIQRPQTRDVAADTAARGAQDAFLAGARTGFMAAAVPGQRGLPTKDLKEQMSAARELSKAEAAAKSIAIFTNMTGRPVTMNVQGHELMFAKDVKNNVTFAYIDGKPASLRDSAKYITAASKLNPALEPSMIMKQMTLAKADPFQRGAAARAKDADHAKDERSRSNKNAADRTQRR